MRFVFLFPLLLLAFAGGVLGQKAKNLKCRLKNPFVEEAIRNFCGKGDIVVPSTYAGNGLKSRFSYASVRINGNCSPPQWVPTEFCRRQFYNICLNGDKLGAGEAKYGRNKCQQWIILASNNGKKGKRDLEEVEESA